MSTSEATTTTRDSEHPLRLARRSVEDNFRSLDDTLDVSLLGSDPETCVQLLKDPWHATALKKQLRQVDEEWIKSFLDVGGLEAVWDVLDTCTAATHELNRSTAILRCTECIRALLAHSIALDQLVATATANRYVDRLLRVMNLSMSPDHAFIKIYPLLILSAIARHSDDGFKATIAAFDLYKSEKQLRHRFSLLIIELSSPHSPAEYQAVIIAFINYLIASCDSITERFKLRSALNALQLPDVLHVICDKDELPDCLLQQLRIYREKQQQDESVVEMPGGINLNDHNDVYRAVFEKFFNTEHSATLLSVLQKLLILERDSNRTGTIFGSLDSFLDKALAVSDPVQVETAHRMTIDKLKKAFEREESRKSESNPMSPSREENAEPTFEAPPSLSSTEAPPPEVPLPSDTLSDPPDLPEVLSAPSPPEVTEAPPPPPPPPPPGAPPPPPPPPGVPGAPPPPPPPPGVPGAPPPPPGVPGAPPPPPGAPGAPPPPCGEEGVGSKLWGVAKVVLSVFQKARQMKPSVKMKRMNWKKIPEQTARRESALWHRASEGDIELPFDVDLIKESVEKFFHNDFKTIKLGKEDSDGPKQVELDSQTQMNINIVLNDLKSIPINLVLEMIEIGLSHPQQSLAAHHFDTIEKALTKKEAMTLAEFDGDEESLGKAEVFVLKLQKIPWCLFRVKVMKLQLTFDESIDHFIELLQLTGTGLEELVQSESLKQVFFIILLIGNIINGNNNQGKAFGFTLSSLEQLTALVANVSAKGTNFIHYLVTVLRNDLPHLLQFPSELPHLYELSRIPFKDIIKEVDLIKEELAGYKTALEEGEPPDDLAQQMNVFIPNADAKLASLEQQVQAVQEKGVTVAEYFCDERPEFVNEVFKEMFNFIEVFNKCVKEVFQGEPIPLRSSSSEEPEELTSSVEEKEKEKRFKHTREAIEAITEEDFDIVTPPLFSQTAAEHPSIQLTPLEEEETEQQPMTLSSAATLQPKAPPPSAQRLYTRTLSTDVSRGYRSLGDKQYSLSTERGNQSQRLPTLFRSISAQPTATARCNNMFGSNIHEVEKVLSRMANAIKKDLQLAY